MSGRVSTLLRMLWHLPFFLRQWSRVWKARSSGDWNAVISHLMILHQRGLATDDSRFWLGCAHEQLGHWEEALAALEQIRKRLDEPEAEAIRHLNHARALWHLGRVDECAELLRVKPDESWSEAQRRRAEDLLEQCS